MIVASTQRFPFNSKPQAHWGAWLSALFQLLGTQGRRTSTHLKSIQKAWLLSYLSSKLRQQRWLLCDASWAKSLTTAPWPSSRKLQRSIHGGKLSICPPVYSTPICSMSARQYLCTCSVKAWLFAHLCMYICAVLRMQSYRRGGQACTYVCMYVCMYVCT